MYLRLIRRRARRWRSSSSGNVGGAGLAEVCSLYLVIN